LLCMHCLILILFHIKYYFSQIARRRVMTVCFFFNNTTTTKIYTLSLHDALPISPTCSCRSIFPTSTSFWRVRSSASASRSCTTSDRKSTRLNSSHVAISYAVSCLKKKRRILDVAHLFARTHRHGDTSGPDPH